MIVWALPLFRMSSRVRVVWADAKDDHSIMFYFTFVSEHVGSMPFLLLKMVHLNFDEMKRLLENVSHNSLLKQHRKYGKLVRQIVTYYFKYIIS